MNKNACETMKTKIKHHLDLKGDHGKIYDRIYDAESKKNLWGGVSPCLIGIQLIDRFAIYIDGQAAIDGQTRAVKGYSLLALLILARGQSVSNERLFEALWPMERGANPESALKTLVFRVRRRLDGLREGLGSCLVAKKGAYCWHMQPGMTVDVFEVEEILDQLEELAELDPKARAELCERLQTLYCGDLVDGGYGDWVIASSVELHDRYLRAIYTYIKQLALEGEDLQVERVCRTALRVDMLDDTLNIELMNALLRMERVDEAMKHFRMVTKAGVRQLGIAPSRRMQAFYHQLLYAGRTLEFDIASIRRDVIGGVEHRRGALVCEYSVFRGIAAMMLRMQKPHMMLAAVRIERTDEAALEPAEQETGMRALLNVARGVLGRGDVIAGLTPCELVLMIQTRPGREAKVLVEEIRQRFLRSIRGDALKAIYVLGTLEG